jgi:hypothetical protein
MTTSKSYRPNMRLVTDMVDEINVLELWWVVGCDRRNGNGRCDRRERMDDSECHRSSIEGIFANEKWLVVTDPALTDEGQNSSFLSLITSTYSLMETKALLYLFPWFRRAHSL